MAIEPAKLARLEPAGVADRHEVEPYQDEERLYGSVTGYLARGLAAGEEVVVIATPAHRDAFRARLEDLGFDVPRLCAAGRMTLLDARATLDDFMVDGAPDAQRFRSRIGAVLERTAAGGRPVRVYGEMVDLLWGDGNRAAATRLDELWNELAQVHTFALLCAYHVGAPGAGDDLGLRRVSTHSHGSGAMSTERHFRLLVESVKDYAIFMLDPGGHIASWNPGAERMKGYHADEIIGEHFSRFYPPEDVHRGKCEHELEVAAREGRFEDEGWRLRKDGTPFWANVIITAVRDEHGNHVGFSKVTRDLSERKEATERLLREQEALGRERAAREHAETIARFSDLFMGMLGHDLRNPLAAIVTAAEIIERLAGEPRDRRLAARITSSTTRMSRMIDQLLDLARIRLGGGLLLDPVRTDLAGLLRQIVDETEAAHRCTVQLAADGDAIGNWDPDRLAQVFSNLLANAAQHGTAGHPIAVELAGDGDGDVTVVVRNRGRIPEETRPVLFQPFRGRERGGGDRGLGLGLYITHEIVRAHRGEVSAATTADDHTEFRVRLPRSAPRR